MGIEPMQSAWEAEILPLNHTRVWSGSGVMSSTRAIATCTSQSYFHLQDLPLIYGTHSGVAPPDKLTARSYRSRRISPTLCFALYLSLQDSYIFVATPMQLVHN